MNQESTAVQKTPGYAWAVLFALYMVTLSATLNLFKVPPLIVTLNTAFNVSFVETGELMGIFSIMGFVLAIPAGIILKRFGIKITALISVAAVAIGPALGALATTFTMLMVGRFIEGIGMGLIMVAAPFAISVWFPVHNRSLPTGLWASSVGLGNVLMLLVAPSLAVSVNWQLVWWICAGFSALSFIIFAIIFRMPREDEVEPAPAPAPEPEPADAKEDKHEKNLLVVVGFGIIGAIVFYLAGLLLGKFGIEITTPRWSAIIGFIIGELVGFSIFPTGVNRSFWMIAIAFGCYNLVVMAITNIYPSYLMEVKNYLPTFAKGPLMHASFVTAFVFGAAIFTAPGGGYISDRLGKRKIMILIPYILMTITFLFPFKVTGAMIPLYTLIFGIVGGPLSAVLLASVPEVAKKPQYIGTGMAVAIFGQNIGMCFAGPLFPLIQEATNWATAGYWMIPICVVGIIATLFIKVR